MNATSADPTPSETILIFTIAGLVIVSVLGIAFSAITVVVIVVSKPLHSPCFTLIAGGGIGSFMVAAHYLARAIDKIGLEMGVFGFQRTGLQCLLLCGVLGIWGIAFHSQLSCLIAIDRLVSVTAPIRYRQLGKRYAFTVLITCAVITTLHEIIGFATAPLGQELLCTEFMDALHPLFIKSYAEINLFYCVVNVLAYGGMMICFRFRHLFSSDAATFQDTFVKQQLAVMPTVKLMVFMYLLTGVLAEILVNVGLQLPAGEPAFILLTAGTILKDASSMVEGLSLFVRNRKFRECFRIMVGCKSNVVTSLVSNTRTRG